MRWVLALLLCLVPAVALAAPWVGSEEVWTFGGGVSYPGSPGVFSTFTAEITYGWEFYASGTFNTSEDGFDVMALVGGQYAFCTGPFTMALGLGPVGKLAFDTTPSLVGWGVGPGLHTQLRVLLIGTLGATLEGMVGYTFGPLSDLYYYFGAALVLYF